MGARYFDIYGSNISIDDYPTMVASPDNYIHLTTWSLEEFLQDSLEGFAVQLGTSNLQSNKVIIWCG